MSASYAGILEKTSDKKRETTCSALCPEDIRGYLAARIKPAFCTLVDPQKKTI